MKACSYLPSGEVETTGYCGTRFLLTTWKSSTETTARANYNGFFWTQNKDSSIPIASVSNQQNGVCIEKGLIEQAPRWHVGAKCSRLFGAEPKASISRYSPSVNGKQAPVLFPALRILSILETNTHYLTPRLTRGPNF
ncbi:hypothetical protein CEXT_871 [Caerostris extrusa]|uniref:Uncharacterized protein n=1 Tax=Caerostris extrusa TaxID=172846 RepID=A0AAV4Y319_CAEEX|nr:hypothetical protein CEXT_871 [Caerostris extrusa]